MKWYEVFAKDYIDGDNLSEKDCSFFSEKFSHQLEYMEARILNKKHLKAEDIEKFMINILDHMLSISRAQKNQIEIENSLRAFVLGRKIIIKEFEKRIITARENRNAGLFVIGLKHFGSSTLQAQRSVAEWISVSPGKVRAGYESVKNRKMWEKQDASRFVKSNLVELANFLANQSTEFPTRYSGPALKTHNSYLDFRSEILHAVRGSRGLPFVHEVFSLVPDWEASRAFHENFSTQKQNA